MISTNESGFAGSQYLMAFDSRLTSASSSRPTSTISDGMSSAMRSSTPRASAISRSCRAASAATARDRHVLQAGIVGVAIDAREPLQLVGHVDEAGDVARDQLDGLRLLRALQPGQPQQRHRGRDRRQRLPPFVRRHARELAQPFGLLGDGLRIQADEGLDGLLQQHADRVMQARDHRDAFRRRRRRASTESIRPRRTASGCRRAAGTRAAPGGATRAADGAACRARAPFRPPAVLAAMASSSGAFR